MGGADGRLLPSQNGFYTAEYLGSKHVIPDNMAAASGGKQTLLLLARAVSAHVFMFLESRSNKRLNVRPLAVSLEGKKKATHQPPNLSIVISL